MNQSPIYEQLITQRMPINDNRDINFSPEVHMLVGTLVPIVSTNTWWFSG